MKDKKIILVIGIIIVAVFFISKGGFKLQSILPGTTDCKDLNTGINKICIRNSPANLGDTEFNADNFYFNIQNDGTAVELRYSGGDWKVVNLENWESNVAHFAGFGYAYFHPFTRGGKINKQFEGWRYLTNSGEKWSEGHITLEKEVILDRRNFVNKVYMKNLGTEPVQFDGSIPSTGLISSTWETNISGKYCGTRNIVQYTSSGDNYLTATYEFTNTISKCPDSHQQLSSEKWKVFFNQPNDTIQEYISILTLTKVNGVDTGGEAQIRDWMENYDIKKQQIKDEFNSFMQSFKFPYGKSNDEKLDYYRFIYNVWTGTTCPMLDNPSQAGLTDNFVINNAPRCYLMPSHGYYGTWIWDSAWTLHGILASIDMTKANNFVKKIVNDQITIWAETQAKYPTIKNWQHSIHTSNFGTLSQPAELYVPVTLDAYQKGLISKDLMCNKLYPALLSHYEKYKQDAGNDYLFSRGSGYGRDGSPLTGGTTEETGAVAGWAMMAVGMATMAKECGLTYSNYADDYAKIKANFESLWVSDRNIYWNKNSGVFKDIGTNNIGTTPYGVCFAIIADLVPKERIVPIFNMLETYYIDGYNVTPSGIGYTSVPTTATYYSPTTRWVGSTWTWADNAPCKDAIDIAINKHGLTQLTSIKDKIYQRELFLIGRYSIYPMESYSSSDGNLAQWSGRPYMPAGHELVEMMNNYNIYTQNFDYSLVSSSIPPLCIENWECGIWSACLNGQQDRICNDSNNCGTIVNKPVTIQSCSSPTIPPNQTIVYINTTVYINNIAYINQTTYIISYQNTTQFLNSTITISQIQYLNNTITKIEQGNSTVLDYININPFLLFGGLAVVIIMLMFGRKK